MDVRRVRTRGVTCRRRPSPISSSPAAAAAASAGPRPRPGGGGGAGGVKTAAGYAVPALGGALTVTVARAAAAARAGQRRGVDLRRHHGEPAATRGKYLGPTTAAARRRGGGKVTDSVAIRPARPGRAATPAAPDLIGASQHPRAARGGVGKATPAGANSSASQPASAQRRRHDGGAGIGDEPRAAPGFPTVLTYRPSPTAAAAAAPVERRHQRHRRRAAAAAAGIIRGIGTAGTANTGGGGGGGNSTNGGGAGGRGIASSSSYPSGVVITAPELRRSPASRRCWCGRRRSVLCATARHDHEPSGGNHDPHADRRAPSRSADWHTAEPRRPRAPAFLVFP